MYQLKQTRKIVALILIVLAATFSIASPARADEEAIQYIKATLDGEIVFVENSHTSKNIAVTVSVVESAPRGDGGGVEVVGRKSFDIIVEPESGRNIFDAAPRATKTYYTVKVESARFK